MPNTGGLFIIATENILDRTIINNDISNSAGIVYTKLTLTNSITNNDINASAGIVYSKLALTGSIVNNDIVASAGIPYSKLSLTGSIVNNDIVASAGIPYSKLSLNNSIVNNDIVASAGIPYSKLSLNNSIVNNDIVASAGIPYSKLTLTTSIVNADINASASIDRSKMNEAGALRARTGAVVSAWDSGNTKYGSLYTDTYRSYLASSNGEIRLLPANGNIMVSGAGQSATLKLYDSTEQWNLAIWTGGGGSIIASDIVDIHIRPASNLLIVGTTGTDTSLRVYGNGTSKYLTLWHSGDMSYVDTNKTYLRLSAGTYIDFNNKDLVSIKTITLLNAISYFKTYAGIGFTNNDSGQHYIISGNFLQNGDGAYAQHIAIQNVDLPEGATITALKMHYRRTEGVIAVDLITLAHATGVATSIASIVGDDTSGNVVAKETSTISAPTVAKTDTSYILKLTIDNVNDIADTSLGFVTITFTVANPNAN